MDAKVNQILEILELVSELDAGQFEDLLNGLAGDLADAAADYDNPAMDAVAMHLRAAAADWQKRAGN